MYFCSIAEQIFKFYYLRFKKYGDILEHAREGMKI